jgi:hypothetical protein
MNGRVSGATIFEVVRDLDAEKKLWCEFSIESELLRTLVQDTKRCGKQKSP